MQKNNLYIILSIFVLVVFSLPFFSQYLYNWDAGQFALGLENYSIIQHQPHPPGYPIFIGLGKILNIWFSANFSLNIVSLLFAALAVIFLFLLSRILLKNQALAVVTTCFLIFNPVFWFYRELALTYTIDAFIGIFLVWNFLKIKENNNYLYLSSLILGLAGGFRPTLIILLFPLFCLNYFYIKKPKAKKIIISMIILIITILTWFIPMIIVSGGFSDYWFAWQNLTKASAEETSLTAQQIKTFSAVLVAGINVLFIPLFFSLYLFIKQKMYRKIKQRPFFWIIILWFIPATTVYCLAHFGQPGYILLILPIFIILSIWGIKYLNDRKWGRIIILLAIFIQASMFIFLNNKVTQPEYYNNTSLVARAVHKVNPWFFKFNQSMIRNNDYKLSMLINDIQKHKPKSTLIVAVRNLVYPGDYGLEKRNDDNFRQMMYYLPNYTIYEVDKSRDFYIKGVDYTTKNIGKKQIKIDPKYKRVIFLAYYIEDQDKPNNVLLSKHINYYKANIEDVSSFEFLGFEFVK